MFGGVRSHFEEIVKRKVYVGESKTTLAKYLQVNTEYKCLFRYKANIYYACAFKAAYLPTFRSRSLNTGS